MRNTNAIRSAGLLGMVVLAAAGCPELLDDYDLGFDAAFYGAEGDDYYWQGYDDSYDTVEDTHVYYAGGDIPEVAEPLYDAGYYDGLWYAYNDGYFVAYDYAFAIGFSEGYDAAFYIDYLDFLAGDVHIEYDNGGWDDGYNDGFSEGRIFGAADYEEEDRPFDWLDALLDYRSGTDLYFEEIYLGTGELGPVVLYEYGYDPTKSGGGSRTAPNRLSIRKAGAAKDSDLPPLTYRALTPGREAALSTRPTTTSRSARPLTLGTTWLERVNAYLGEIEAAAKSAPRARAVAQ